MHGWLDGWIIVWFVLGSAQKWLSCGSWRIAPHSHSFSLMLQRQIVPARLNPTLWRGGKAAAMHSSDWVVACVSGKLDCAGAGPQMNDSQS